MGREFRLSKAMHTVTLGEKMEQLRIGVIGAGGKAVDYAASWAKMPDRRQPPRLC